MAFLILNMLKIKKKVEMKVDNLLDAIAPFGKCNLVDAVSAELPLFTLCEMLGVPEADRPKIIEWMKLLKWLNLGCNSISSKQSSEV